MGVPPAGGFAMLDSRDMSKPPRSLATQCETVNQFRVVARG